MRSNRHWLPWRASPAETEESCRPHLWRGSRRLPCDAGSCRVPASANRHLGRQNRHLGRQSGKAAEQCCKG